MSLRPLSRATLVDVGLAACVLGIGAAELVERSDVRGGIAANLLTVAVVAGAVGLRRIALLVAVGLLTAAYVVNALWLARVEETSIGWCAFVALAYAAGRYGSPMTRPLALVGLGGAIETASLLQAHLASDLIFPPLIGLAFAGAGLLVRRRAALSAELHEATLEAEDVRERQARDAEADERRRIARELHDVVAHSVSVMVVQAAGARRILDQDPTRAAQAAALIERTGREALAEMRRTLGVVGDPDGEEGREPQPTLEGLDALVDRFRAAGLDVDLRRTGDAVAPAGADLAAYRIVQEALTNVLRHAGGARVVVALDARSEGDLLIEVRNDAGSGPTGLTTGGNGLVGMAERAGLYGGRLDAAPLPGGGFRVAAHLRPRPQEALA